MSESDRATTPKAKPQAKPEAKAKSGKKRAIVNVELLSWRPHPLPRGADATDVLPADVLEACVADGRVVYEQT